MATFPVISYKRFDEWLEQGKVTQPVDLREPWMYEYDRSWGDMNIPYEELGCSMDLIRGNGTMVLCYDQGAKDMVICRDPWKLGYGVVDPAEGMSSYRGEYTDRNPASAIEWKP